MAQVLAERIRHQIEVGEQVLETAGDRSDAVFGSPRDVLTVRGNVADVAHMNHLWLLDLVAAGVGSGEVPAGYEARRPTSIPEAAALLEARETDTAEEALACLRCMNEAIAARIEGLSDEELEREIDATFAGPTPIRTLLFYVLEHGYQHLGQATGILKGAGIFRWQGGSA